MLKRIMVVITFIVVSFSIMAITADEIIKKVDEKRLVSDTAEIRLTLEYFRNDKLQDKNIMRGYVKDQTKNMMEFLEPATVKGRKILTVEDDMWMFFPNTKRPVRITAAQKLMGGFSNGDIAKTSFANDYTAEFGADENVEGKECYRIELTTKKASSTYNKITLWASKDEVVPVKAEFFAQSGKKLKTALYKDLKIVEGKKVITKMFLYDAILTNEYSIMTYDEMKSVTVDDKYFNKDYLQRM